MDKIKAGIDKLSSDDFIDLYNYSRLTEVKEDIFDYIKNCHKIGNLPYEDIVNNYILEKYQGKVRDISTFQFLAIRNLFEDGLICGGGRIESRSGFYYQIIPK